MQGRSHGCNCLMSLSVMTRTSGFIHAASVGISCRREGTRSVMKPTGHGWKMSGVGSRGTHCPSAFILLSQHEAFLAFLQSTEDQGHRGPKPAFSAGIMAGPSSSMSWKSSVKSERCRSMVWIPRAGGSMSSPTQVTATSRRAWAVPCLLAFMEGSPKKDSP